MSGLAITFTRRAAAEMRERLQRLLPERGARVPVMTFHALGLSLLEEHDARLGLPRPLRVVSEAERRQLSMDELSLSARKTDSLLARVSRAKRERSESAGERQADPDDRRYDDALRPPRILPLPDQALRAVVR